MKKIVFIFVMFLALFLVGCDEPTPPVVTPEDDFDKIFAEFVKYVDENVPFIVTEDVSLPLYFILSVSTGTSFFIFSTKAFASASFLKNAIYSSPKYESSVALGFFQGWKRNF